MSDEMVQDANDTPIESAVSAEEIQEATGTPSEKINAAPADIMPDADPEAVRVELRRARDDAAKYRVEAREAMQRIEKLETSQERLDAMQEQIAKNEEYTRRLEFKNIALGAGVPADLADVMDISRFDLDDPEGTADKLRTVSRGAARSSLPDAGRPVVTKKEKTLTIDDIAEMSPEEFRDRLPEITKLRAADRR